MVNCNPETVSTDYDTSDKLYFESLTVEDVLSIYWKEQPEGVIIQFGGQTPLNIARELAEAGVRILGTSPETIDLAEDRDRFRQMMRGLGIPMPESGMANNLEEALAVLEDRKGLVAPESPLTQNPAKQLAGRLFGRVPIVIAAGALVPVARRWKTQFNENSKSWAYFEALPEMDHNALSGIHFPKEAADRFRVIFLQHASLHPRNALRLDLTRQVLEGQGIGCERVLVPGGSELAQILSAVQLGDFASTYLALLYGADPTAIEDIVGLKEQMTDR